MYTSNQRNNGKFVILLFVTEIFSTFSGKLLRFPGNSLFLSSFWNVWLFLNFISPFISLGKTVLSLYFDTKWAHLIYIIRNVFQPKKKSIQAALISSLESHFTSLLCHSLECSCKPQPHWGHPWKTKKTEDTDVRTTIELDEPRQVDSTAHSGHGRGCLALVRGV